MAETIPDLWSDDIRVDVLSPLAILRTQQGLLKKRTQGILDAKITTVEENGLTLHQFDLIAPSVQRYQERVLVVQHDTGRVYPVIVEANSLEHFNRMSDDDLSNQKVATTESEFIEIVREVFQSKQVRSSIQSLVAQSNEAQASPSS